MRSIQGQKHEVGAQNWDREGGTEKEVGCKAHGVGSRNGRGLGERGYGRTRELESWVELGVIEARKGMLGRAEGEGGSKEAVGGPEFGHGAGMRQKTNNSSV